MIWGRLIGAGLGLVFAAATGYLVSREPGQDQGSSQDPTSGPRSEEGGLLENWLEFCKYFFDRDKTYDLSTDSRSNLLSEVKEFSLKRLTRGDKYWIAERLSELHDICMRRDVQLKVSGLEDLETGAGFYKKSAVTIEVDPARPYDMKSHPNPPARDKPTSGPAGATPN